MEAAVAHELRTDQAHDADAGVRRGWCAISTDNILHGGRRRKQASNIWLDPQGPCAELRELLLKDVGDEIRSAACDEDFQDDESVRTSDEEDRSDRDGATDASDESDGSSESGNESQSDSDSESDGDYETASEISDTSSSVEEFDDCSSMDVDEDAYAADGEGETDQWASDGEDEDEMDEDELELDLQGLTLLEMDYAEFDDFVADLDPERWCKRPHELTDCWTDRRRAWQAGGHKAGK